VPTAWATDEPLTTLQAGEVRGTERPRPARAPQALSPPLAYARPSGAVCSSRPHGRGMGECKRGL